MKRPSFEKSCASNPELVKIWSTENELKPEQVYLKSGKKFKWNCFTCNHTYDQTPNNKYKQNQGCPYCAIPNKILCDNVECLYCLNKSCASNEEYIKIWNDKKDPRQVLLTSCIKIEWKCLKCNHIYLQYPATKNQGCGCPYCATPSNILCGTCDSCINKSCYSKFLEIWNDELDPRFVFLNSNYKINWKCNKCNHIYDQLPNNKSGCPYCTNKKLCKNNNCKDCFNKSCASNKILVKIWTNENKINPRQVFLGSSVIKINWKCNECNNNYYQTPNTKSSGSGCPNCKNKTEKKVIIFLKSKNIKIKKEFKLSNDTKRYDILCKDYNIIIEIDGIQHFKDMKFFKSAAKENQENDKNKMLKAMKQGYSFIRIFQEDIWNDNIDWQNLILDNLKVKSKPTILYFSSIETLYDNHQLEC